ncbi:MAG: hypothetical protein GF399_04555 [Candidatus Coatesbacteria bacterium]|nr:hypothetical protein [Candidatus Coatesbacteria bacterium]
MSAFEELDLSRLRCESIAERPSKVTLNDIAAPPSPPDTALLDRLPDQLVARDLRRIIARVAAARRQDYPVIVGAGAHLVKLGLGPLLADLVRRDLVTGLAVNGAFVIHDLELAHFGKTSEDVAAQLARGMFGMCRDTAELVNGAFILAREEKLGAGEALGLVARDGAHADISVLAACSTAGVPLTVHVALGTDIVHMHPSCDGAAVGEASLRDFRILAAQVARLGGRDDAPGGCYLNWGSAVLLPEVFLKAVALARNLGMQGRFTTAAFDFNIAYRVGENVVRRPSPGDGLYLVGPHELLLPLFHAGVLRSAEPRNR